MALSKIQLAFHYGFEEYSKNYFPNVIQLKAAHSILRCKTGFFGYNTSFCSECGYLEFHTNSCRNRNCPNCQAIQKEIWIDKRRSEVIDSPYFHVVFTIPASLNSLVYANQKLLYDLLHKASSQTLLELSQNPRFLGATPGIIQVLHTWGQELNFHPHIHCIVSGAGLSKDLKLKKCGKSFFIPAKVLSEKFKGKFLYYLDRYYKTGLLTFSASCSKLKNASSWQKFKDSLYSTTWAPHIKETFNGNGNAIDYLGRYTHRIAITNTRIKEVTREKVSFTAKDYITGKSKIISLPCAEFVRRIMMHVLPSGFQKIRYFGFLNNRCKKKYLSIIFNIQGHQHFLPKLSGLSMPEILKTVWDYDITFCRSCGCFSMRHLKKSYNLRC